MNILQQPFFQITIPLLFGLYLASWYSGKRFEDLKQHLSQDLGEVKTRLTAIESRLANVEKKVEGLEIKAWR